MSLRNIFLLGNKKLRENSEEIDSETDPVESYIGDLRDTLHRYQRLNGIGRAIAAPQIGYLKQIIYMESEGLHIIMINPRIVEKSGKMFEVWDSCFRADTDENREQIRKTFSDELSELFQHEIDHLGGILFTDRIIDQQIIMRREWEKMDRLKEA